jgi:Rrf2 family nitric oxide-sensitive transcriptional repressor
MQLTLFSDYALRLVLYLAVHRERVVPIDEVSRAFGISKNHLAKVVSLLLDLNVVESVRGRSGGLRLARSPSEITVGWLVRRTEPNLNLVECFEPRTNTCPIASVCVLKGVLREARESFLAALDRSTIADLAAPDKHPALVRVWNRALAAHDP